MPRFPVSFRPPAFASWSSFVRWGVGPSLRSAYRACCQGPDPNGVVTFRTHEMRPGRVPSIPRELWCPHGRHGIVGRHLPLRNGQSLDPGPTIHKPGLRLTRHHRGFTAFTLPAFPSPVVPGWNGSPWASPPSFTPRRCRRRMSRWGQALGTCLSYVTINWSSNLRNYSIRAPSWRTPASRTASGDIHLDLQSTRECPQGIRLRTPGRRFENELRGWVVQRALTAVVR
jgi:hypothetical protein